MGDDNKAAALFTLTGDTLKNWGVVISIAMTLFGVISFASGRISQYDGYNARLSKLEAREQIVMAIADQNKEQQFSLNQHQSELGIVQGRIERMSNDVVSIRLSIERLQTILESRK